MNPNLKALKTVSHAGILLAAALTFGCQTDKSSVTEFFPAEEGRSVDQFTIVQAASGARAEATLQSLHFDGENLNSLGEAKLDLMLKDDDSVEALVVYLNLDDTDSAMSGRKDSVTGYLVEHGMVKDQISLKTGPNPNVTTLAAKQIAGLNKLDAGEAVAAPPDETK